MFMASCGRGTSPVERSLYADMERVSAGLCDEAFDAGAFGMSLGQRIAQLHDQDAARGFLLKFEGNMRDFHIAATRFNDRKRQLAKLRSMLGWIGHGIHENGGPEEWAWNMRILGLEVMAKEIAWAKSGKAKDEWHEQRRGPLLFATGMTADRYAHSLQDDYELAVRDLEKSFNEKASSEIPEESIAPIRAHFEKAMGRPIRTDEEIRRDRERKIEKARTEAIRRHEEMLGDDVRGGDIESL